MPDLKPDPNDFIPVAVLRFYGTAEDLEEWKEALFRYGIRKPGKTLEAKPPGASHYFEVTMTALERSTMHSTYWTGNGPDRVVWSERIAHFVVGAPGTRPLC